MNRLESLINEYVSADESARLHLFLAHRELRDAFMQIDLAEARRIKAEQPVPAAFRWVDRLLQFCPAFPKM